MKAIKIQDTLIEIQRNMMELAPYRAPSLFNEFLVQGYTAITLSSVSSEKFDDLLRAKVCLGTLITLYDDYADRPSQCDPQLLEALYRLNFASYGDNRCFDSTKRQVMEFASSLFHEIDIILYPLPHHESLRELLDFDLMQFYSANRYSSLVTAQPHAGNALENRTYAHHNMGMIMASMMDLMATEHFDPSELGPMREVFLMGQRMGRIFNVLTTHRRELVDGDLTGELAICRSESELMNEERNLRQEIIVLHKKILTFESLIKTFSVKAYAEGLIQVQRLHEKMEGTL